MALLLAAACTRGGGDDTAGSSAPSSVTSAPTTAAPGAECALGGEGQSTRSIDVDGQQRSYVVSVPSTYGADRPVPVVMVVHGLGGTAEQILAYSRWPEFGRADGFVVVAPQSNTARRSWDFVRGPDQQQSDARFLVRLSEELANDPCLDADRQYLTGMSNGAAMTFAMACFDGDRFAAYGAVSAAGFQQDRCAKAPPVSIVYFHGTDDRIVPIGGGDTPITPVKPLTTTLAAWAEHDGCAARPQERDVADDVERRRWTGCDDGTRIDAYVVDGGGHTWPGSAAVPFLGATTTSIDATAIMARFFDLD